MNRQKLLIRFKKEGDLRLISHRDLARAFERLFRRIQLPLAMSQGFHPHPKISFSSALALGIEGSDEIVEVVLDEPVEITDVLLRLNQQAPAGLVVKDIQEVLPGQKPKVNSATYQIRIPDERIDVLKTEIEKFLNADCINVERKKRKEPINIRPGVELLELHGNVLQMKLSIRQEFSVKPREVLTALQIQDLEMHGSWLTRSKLELKDDADQPAPNPADGIRPRDSHFEPESNQL